MHTQNAWQLLQLPENGRLTPEQIQTYADDSSGKWLDVPQMPMQVHDVLRAHGIVGGLEPIDAEKEQAWTAESDWLYRLRLPPQPESDFHDLRCDGLDTVVDVWCNRKHVAFHDNCHLPLRVSLSEVLHADADNVILLHFYGPVPYIETEMTPRLSEHERSLGVRAQSLLRKPRQDFGQFLGRRFAPVGPYRSISLVRDDDAIVDQFDCASSYDRVNDRGQVEFSLAGRGESGRIRLAWELRDADGNAVDSGEVCGWERPVRLDIESPQLWYPVRLGRQYLYQLHVSVRIGGKEPAAFHRSIGFREMEMTGPFAFRVNGIPLRLWGLNLAPLKPGKLWDHKRAMLLLDLAENANANILRLWGPGQPFDESILDEADRRGILIWYEFQHEYHPIPENREYYATCVKEAEHQVRKHRHHPSILLWSGGNEAYLTLDAVASPQQARKAQTARELFDVRYKEVCTALDPQRYYHPQSPSGGDYGNDPSAGDTHMYNDLCVVPGCGYPVFITEHFRFTVPPPHSLRHWLGDDAWPDGFSPSLHSQDGGGLVPETWRPLFKARKYETYQIGPIGDFYERTETLEDLCDRLGAASMKYIRDYVERFRRGRPRRDWSGVRRCRGHMWWKFNDTWPMVRNGLVDACGEPTAAYYAMKRAYAPVLISFEIDEDDRIAVWIVNDSGQTVEGTLHLERRDENGEIHHQQLSRPVHLEHDVSQPIVDLSVWGMFWRNSLLIATLTDASGNMLTQTSFVVAPEVACLISDPELSARVDGEEVWISCKRYARRVTLHGVDSDGNPFGHHFDDNYFDLVPGEQKCVRMLKHVDGCQVRITATGVVAPLNVFADSMATRDQR